MNTHGLRVTHGPYRGDIVTLGRNRSWESAAWLSTHKFQTLATEVVELDNEGNLLGIIEACRHKCACTSDDECPHDCTCGGAA